MQKRIAALTLSAISTIALASPAMAQGSWTSYWSGVLTGANTRTWSDSNNDAVGTKTSFRYCKSASGVKNITVQLTYDNTFTPDQNMGNVTYSCASSTFQTYNYGDLKKGNYHATLNLVNGSTRAVSPVNVGSATTHGIAVSY
jgi:hypothetical protein